jgi:hypothetical protein
MSLKHNALADFCLGASLLLVAALAGCAPAAPAPGDSAGAAPARSEAKGQATVASPDAAPPTAATPSAAEAIPSAASLTPEELTDGWIALFDGESLFGWKASSKADWRVEQGAIVVTSGDKGLLCTTAQFSNYVLKVDFRSAERTNSGIFLHTPLEMGDPAKDCYEVNVAPPDNPFPTGSLVQRQKAAGRFDSDQWQSCEVTVQDDRVTVKLDGRAVAQYADPRPLRRGHVGLQFNEGRVEFRNIRLRPLGLASLFNGKDLTGWKTYPDLPTRSSVTAEGYLNIKNGRGPLETENRFGDFVLQLECMTHAANLNSGVFFRCLPGPDMNGYESQIHNGFKDGDRNRPFDCGTGGIFRRIDARRVVADDLTWFHKTIVVDGPHVAVWVNGYQVTDWTDDRKPDENPRKGLRLASGTIMLQGHDPTTDISFRNLRIAEMPVRGTPEAK